ncbi:MAG: DUF4129 domain-containing protein [Thermoplasmata archaeon]|nr:DUF4129 domain-containing protein [Thermoplasmata archaeon]
MTPGSRKRIMTMVLLILIVFCIGNLIYNVERLVIGDEIILEQDEAPEEGSYLASSSSMAQTVRYMMIGLMGIGIAITIGGIIYGTATKDKEFLKSMLYPIIGGGLAIIFFVGVFAYTELEKSEYVHNERLDTGYTLGNSSANATDSTIDGSPPDGMDIAVSVMVAGGAIAILVLIVYSIAQLTHLRSETFSDIDMDAMTEGVEQTIQRAMDDMTSGTDVRSSIMRCYSDMCKLAAQHGIADEEHLTPREFETLIGSKLPVTDEKLHALILIFEEARYSDHDLSEDMKERALGALGRIKDDLVVEEVVEDCEVVDKAEVEEPSNSGGEKGG